MKSFYTAASAYYANWLDVEPKLLQSKGIYTICTPKREKRQKGYGMRFPLYCMCRDGLLIITHCEEYQNQILRIVSLLNGDTSTALLKETIHAVFSRDPGHSVKHYFTKQPDGIDTSTTVQLTPEHYPVYLHFHTKQYPNANQETWLQEYFERITRIGLIFAIFDGSEIASATDAPDVPYMADIIVTPGINTLDGYRRKGYATACISSQIRHLLSVGKIPVWSCASDNTGSARLAARVGFKKFAETVTLSESI